MPCLIFQPDGSPPALYRVRCDQAGTPPEMTHLCHSQGLHDWSLSAGQVIADGNRQGSRYCG